MIGHLVLVYTAYDIYIMYSSMVRKLENLFIRGWGGEGVYNMENNLMN